MRDSTGMTAGENGNNRWDWDGNENKTWPSLGVEMGIGMNH